MGNERKKRVVPNFQTEPELTPKIPGPVASADLFDLHCAAYDTKSVQLQEYRSSASIHAVGL